MTADTLPFHLLLLLVGVITLSSWSIISSVDGSIASFSPTSSFSYRQPPAWLLAEMAPLKGAKRHDLATVAKAHARWKRSMVDIRTLLCNRIIKCELYIWFLCT
jgi:hypothetical protein